MSLNGIDITFLSVTHDKNLNDAIMVTALYGPSLDSQNPS